MSAKPVFCGAIHPAVWGGGRVERLHQTSVVRFGTYELHSGELRKAGLRIKVQQQPLRLLEMLLERPGEIVTREELRSRMWPQESFGDFDQAVNVAVAKLRTALGDSADNPRFVETIPRRGYRFLAEVSVSDPSPRHPLVSSDQTSSSQANVPIARDTPPRSNRMVWAVAAVAAVLLLSTSVWVFLKRGSPEATSLPGAPVSGAVSSLAVLPLENLSTDSQDYFADGMTDELITDLAQIGALRVISRTSIMPYKGIRKPLGQIARELNVDAVVEGTVLRSGTRVRITAQLIRAPADQHLWAQSYEGDVRDTLALQKKVAREIAEQIRITITPKEAAALATAKMVNPEAYDSYLKGQYFSKKRTADDFRKATAYFSQAIAIEPNYALPHAGLADIYQLSDRPQLAREEVQRALKLDDQSAEAHNSLANLLYLFNHDWQGAEKEFKRAVELDHNYAPAHHWYSMYLALEGRREEALAEAQKAYELDPLSPVVGANLAKILQEDAQYDLAIEQAKKTLDLEPNSALTHAVLGVVYHEKKMYTEAIAEYKKALQLGGSPSEYRGLLGYTDAVSGNHSEAKKMIAELKTLRPRETRAALDIAVVYSGLGNRESAMQWLEKAEHEHVTDLIGIEQDARFSALRTDPRFRALARRIGGPPNTGSGDKTPSETHVTEVDKTRHPKQQRGGNWRINIKNVCA
jgi:TolB-like protein/DNA-binding winged helix-turn-helix (wHTH) protein/Tfp pilus assembly protein PilF